MLKKIMLSLICALGLTNFVTAAPTQETKIGVVNFANCITESKIGKQEQSSFETLKTQLSQSLEGLEKEINEMSVKFNDKDYLEGLSPEAEDEMKSKFHSLNEDLARNQNQYYQLLNQANMRIIQSISANINAAAEKIAKDKKLAMVLNKEAVFFYDPSLDVTPAVVSEMDKTFNENQAKQVQAKKEADTKEEAK
jgi:outer membrane protein